MALYVTCLMISAQDTRVNARYTIAFNHFYIQSVLSTHNEKSMAYKWDKVCKKENAVIIQITVSSNLSLPY